jgi:NADH-quinone oxidoreductase subunit E
MDNEIKFSAESLELVKSIIARYPEGKQKSALLPTLHIAQAEFGGWLSVETMNYVAGLLKLEQIEVYEVATFYSMFNLKPVGECVMEVCQTGPCMLNGAGEIIQHISKKLNIKPGETTADGKFTLKTVECLAACGTAPVMMVGDKYHENLTTEKVDSMIDDWCKCGKSSHTNPYKD